MDIEELNRFALQHTSEISKTTVALFKHFSGEADHFVSGELLQVEGTRFLVTAAHVSDEFFCEHWKQIFFGTPSFDELIPVITVKYCRSKKRSDPHREDDLWDLAVFELRPDIADRLSVFMRFVTLHELELDPDKLKDGQYLVLGYPEFRAEKDEMDQTIVAQVLPYFAGLYDMKRNPAPDISPADHLVLDINRLDQPDGAGDKLDLDQTHGISGGGMWRILDEDEPIESLDWRQTKLVAIITDGSVPEVMGPSSTFAERRSSALLTSSTQGGRTSDPPHRGGDTRPVRPVGGFRACGRGRDERSALSGAKGDNKAVRTVRV